MSNETLKLLKDGRARIAKGWCVGYFAMDENLNETPSNNPRAVAWCALGAIQASGVEPYAVAQPHPVFEVLAKAIPSSYVPDYENCSLPGKVADFNNRHKQADVLALFDRAIASLQPGCRPDSALVADLIEKVVGQTLPVEAVSEELTWA